MKLLFILIAATAVGCSTAKKTADTGSASAKTTTSSETATKNHEDAHKAAHEKATKSSSGSEMHCKSGKEERVLALSTTDEGCKLAYTKAGKTSEVAKGGKGSKHCEEVQEKIQKKLEDSGYNCQ